jgi:hypothetical protein
LTIEFCHLARAKRFRKSGEPLKEVS